MQIYIKYEPNANFPNIVANVRRYVHVAAAWGWHGFLLSCWMWRFFRFMKFSRSAKTMIRQLAEERPGVQPGPAGWFLRGGFSR